MKKGREDMFIYDDWGGEYSAEYGVLRKIHKKVNSKKKGDEDVAKRATMNGEPFGDFKKLRKELRRARAQEMEDMGGVFAPDEDGETKRRGRPRESEVEKYFRKRCQDMGWTCLKFTSPSTTGVPDRIVIRPQPTAHPAKVVFVEMKTKDGKLSPRQEHWRYKFVEMGATYCKIDSKARVDEYIDAWRREDER